MTDLRSRLRAVPTPTGTPPDEVEFWQADPGRRHTRLRYHLEDTWTKELLWP